MSRVLAVIPARGGSKGVPRKNIRELGGKPLIVWTIEAALASERITRLVCSTDDEEIASVCRGHGLPVPFLRPAALGGDATRMQDVVLDLLERLEERFDRVLLLQPTAPLRTSADIDAAIALAEKHDADSVVSFARVETHHPYYMYRLLPGDPPHAEPLLTYAMGTPRQEFPPIIYRNGAIYLVKQDYFQRERSFVSPDMIPYLMPAERSVNLDTEEDFAYLEWRLSRRV